MPKIELPKSVENAVSNLSDEPTRHLGHVVTSVIDICFGGINYYAERLDISRKMKLEKWIATAKRKLEEIPEEQFQDAPLEIAGPLTEASKFYFENEQLSEMFTNLLVSSCDKSKLSKVHPCFVELIKQMSSIDAELLMIFKYEDQAPIVNYKVVVSEKQDYNYIKRFVFLVNNSFDDVDLNATSLINLERLGLLEIKMSEYFNNDSYYEKFNYYPLYKDYNLVPNSAGFPKKELEKGIVRITPFGRSFLEVCVK